jgi:hypothetical protein
MKQVRAMLVLVMALVANSAFAVGPGLEAFEEGKGTIGMVCTDQSGRQYAALPAASVAMRSCTGARDLSACLDGVVEQSRREFGNCLHGVQGQWVAEVVREGTPVGGSVWNYVDGASEYRNVMSGFSTAVISGRTEARRRAGR